MLVGSRFPHRGSAKESKKHDVCRPLLPLFYLLPTVLFNLVDGDRSVHLLGEHSKNHSVTNELRDLSKVAELS